MTFFCEKVMLRKEAAERARVRSSHPEAIDRRGRSRFRGHAWTRRSTAAAPPVEGQSWVLIDQRLGTVLHGGSGDDAFCAPEGPGVSLAPVPGLLSIAAGSVIVEVLVGWSPVLPRRSPPPPKVTWCPCGFPPRKKK